MSSGEAPARVTTTLTHGNVTFGFDAIGILALPNIPARTHKIIIKILVLNLVTAVETIPIIYP